MNEHFSVKACKTISTAWYLLYLVPIVITVFAAVLKYPSLPGQVPVHFNFVGEADRYASKSIRVVAMMPLLQFLIGLLFGGMNLGIRISGPQRNSKRTQAFQRMMSIALFVIGLLLMVMFACLQLTMLSIINQKVMQVLPFIFLAAIVAICVYLVAVAGQGGSRLKKGDNAPIHKEDDDRDWLFGFLYCNKNDPALFVEKRFGIGYTINFGNPKGFLAIAVLVVFILAITGLPFLLK